MHRIPRDHPRYESLRIRQLLVSGAERGLAVREGLLAHGRGEAFDYLLGERTGPEARRAARAAAAALLLAGRPVLSVNGNVASLAAPDIVRLAAAIPGAVLEVNLFHRTEGRARMIGRELRAAGRRLGARGRGLRIFADDPDARLAGLSSERARCHREGMLSADLVLVPLEDGDRAEALKRAGKTVVTVDLNPLSRTARAADITIVDNVVRALPELWRRVEGLRGAPRARLGRILGGFDNRANLARALDRIGSRLAALARAPCPPHPAPRTPFNGPRRPSR
ncbi:MAG: phosphopantothenate/pantothenate synthetase [Euryarchaeota archaeon]|nr:phosphopantothenate/pantothenate synthetase [Euryarchaeota archaeon]